MKRMKKIQDHVVERNQLVIKKERVEEILIIMRDKFKDKPEKAKRFQCAHDLHLICTNDVIFPIYYVNSNTTTEPDCSLCQRNIGKGEDRCKYSIIHSDYPQLDVCETHIFCVECFYTARFCTKTGSIEVCYGTSFDGNGCRKPKRLRPILTK